MANFLILGGGSQLASYFYTTYSKETILVPKKSCDVRLIKQVEKTIQKFTGKYVINCAAITNMIACEDDPKICLEVNTIGTYVLNLICKKYKKKLIHISSNYAINPPNTYGWSKYLSEKFVDKNFLVIRTNFYSTNSYILNNLLHKKKISAFTNVFSNPVSISRLVKEIYNNRNSQGVLNIFTKGEISYYDFALLICDTFSFENKLVIPTTYVSQKPFLTYHSVIKSDITIDRKKDMELYKNYISNYGNH